MRKFFLLLFFSLITSYTDSSIAEESRQSATQVAAAKALLSAMDYDASIQLTISAMVEQTAAILKQQSPDKSSKIDDILARLKLRYQANKPLLIDQVALVYAQHFSTDEMKEITSFYQHGAGRKLIQLQPDLVQASAQMASVWSAQINRDFAAEYKKQQNLR